MLKFDGVEFWWRQVSRVFALENLILTKRQALYGRAKVAKNGAKLAKNGANHFQKEDSYPRLYGTSSPPHIMTENFSENDEALAFPFLFSGALFSSIGSVANTVAAIEQYYPMEGPPEKGLHLHGERPTSSQSVETEVWEGVLSVLIADGARCEEAVDLPPNF
jgi:hypothetical protein